MLTTLLLAGLLDGMEVVPVPAPSAEPVSLALTKKHLDVARDDQDELIAGYIVAAREWVEGYTGLTLATREVVEIFDGFDKLDALRTWPIVSGSTIVARYHDEAGVEQMLSTAFYAGIRPVRLRAGVLPGTPWPVSISPVTVIVQAGYGDAAKVPAALKSAILLLVGSMYAQRETVVIGTIATEMPTALNLCHPYRLPVIG